MKQRATASGKTRWRDGTTQLLFEPIELIERLAAQIPKPRVNLVLHAGVLAPHAAASNGDTNTHRTGHLC